MIKFIGQKDNAENVSVFWNRIKQIFAPLHSPEFTGTPHAPTPASGNNTTRIATTAFVADALESVDALPSQTGQSGKFLTTDGTDASWGTVTIPTKVSDLTNDAGYITGYTETDPTVPSWAKQSTKPSYTAAEVGALPANEILIVEKGGTGLSSLTSGSFLRANSDRSFGQRTPAQVLSDIGALPISGGTLTGALTLSGAPTANLHPATKKYVDDIVGNVESLLASI